jgi:hypothetical protein
MDPVHIFNPTGYGTRPSTVRWSILVGCTDYSTAVRRARTDPGVAVDRG